jgi:hypothetical protein
MFRALLLFAVCVLVKGQESGPTSSVTYDLHGRPVAGPTVVKSSSASGYRRAEYVESLNGRKVPIHSIEERLLKESGGVKVVERIVRRYDPNGRPGPPERTIIEETKTSDGGASVLESRYRVDLNGREQLWERARTQRTIAGSMERSETVLERQGLNASLEFAEKKTTVIRSTPAGSEKDVTTTRRNESGRMYEAAREVTTQTTRDGIATENIARYETPSGGRLQLTEQVVKRTIDWNGGTRTEIDIYSADIAGRPQGQPLLREQQVVERKPIARTGFTESVSVRRPSVNEPNKAGRFNKVSEVVCTGSCSEDLAGSAVSGGPRT